MASYPIDFTLSAASVDRTTATYPDAATGDTKWRKFKPEHIPGGEGVSGDTAMGIQVLRIFPVFSTAAATATLQVAIVDLGTGAGGETTDPVVAAWTITCAAGTIRTGLAGATLNYVGTAVDAVTGRDTIDLLGHLKRGTEVYIGATALSAGTIRVRAAVTRNAG